MGATSTRLMTVEEFRRLPEPQGFRYELHHGELVEMTFPRIRHVEVQARLMQTLLRLAGTRGTVRVELPFRARPEYELRAADVAYVTESRWQEALRRNELFAAPDLVIEVLSPSNTAQAMLEREALCLENGAQEFWQVDPDSRTVRVTTRDGHVRRYGNGDVIRIELFDGAELRVEEIFS